MLGILVCVSVCKLVSVRAMKKVCRTSRGITQLILHLGSRWRRPPSGPVTLSPETLVCVCVCVCIHTHTHTHVYTQNDSFVTRLLFKCIYTLHVEAVFSFVIFVLTTRLHGILTRRPQHVTQGNIWPTETTTIRGRIPQECEFSLFWPEFRIVFPCHTSSLLVSGLLYALLNNAVTISYIIPSNNRTHKWTMNSEGYRSDRGVFMDGLRKITILTTQGSQIPVRDLNPRAAKSVAVDTARPRRSLFDMLTGP